MKKYIVYTRENNTNTVIEAQGLTLAEGQVINLLNDLGLTHAEITCSNGNLSIVRKDSNSHHWNHPGFSFSWVWAANVDQYRKIQDNV